MLIKFKQSGLLEICFPNYDNFYVSKKGESIWGEFTTQNVFFKVFAVRLDLYKHFFYIYQHKSYIKFIKPVEDLNLLVTGGNDKKLVLQNLTSGKTIKVFDVKRTFIDVERIGLFLFISTETTLFFFNLSKKEFVRKLEKMVVYPLNWTKVINHYSHFSPSTGNKTYLLLIDTRFLILSKVKLPREITSLMFRSLPLRVDKKINKKYKYD